MKALHYIMIAGAAAAIAVSCSKWTSPEPLDYTPSPVVRSAEYMENLLAFKAKKTHKVSIAMLDSQSEAPTRANQHLDVYPDSLDYIGLVGTKPLYPSIAEEMATVRERGTKLLHVVDYSIAWDAWFNEHLELEEGFLATLREYTDAQIAALNAYDYDGIVISYTGKTSTDIESRAQKQFLDAVLGWVSAHEGKTVIFRGYARNLENNSFLSNCEYIIIVPGANTSVGALTVAVNAQLVAGVPKDRLVMEVSIPEAIDGEWVGPNGAQAAAWVKDYTSGINKKGVAFFNAQEDYYNSSRTFPQIRDGINLCN